jgi:hypothetical protein
MREEDAVRNGEQMLQRLNEVSGRAEEQKKRKERVCEREVLWSEGRWKERNRASTCAVL